MSGFEEVRAAEIGGARLTFREAGGGAHVALLLHGHTQTPLMWAEAARRAEAAGWHVIAPSLDVRGTGDAPTKVELAAAFGALVAERTGPDAATVVIGHDLGAMVAYAYAATQAPQAVALLEATPPGVGFWSDLLADPRTWHFGFYGPVAEALIEGREEIYLARFWTEFTASGASPMGRAQVEDTLATLRAPGGLRAALAQFAALPRDAEDNARLAQTPLDCPVLAVGGDASLGPAIGAMAELVARDVRSEVIPGAGHWLLEEAPGPTLDLLDGFLAGHRAQPQTPRTDPRTIELLSAFVTGGML